MSKKNVIELNKRIASSFPSNVMATLRESGGATHAAKLVGNTKQPSGGDFLGTQSNSRGSLLLSAACLNVLD
jgi:hypothetical protein